jgi:hypothetical protein
MAFQSKFITSEASESNPGCCHMTFLILNIRVLVLFVMTGAVDFASGKTTSLQPRTVYTVDTRRWPRCEIRKIKRGDNALIPYCCIIYLSCQFHSVDCSHCSYYLVLDDKGGER